MFNIDNFKRQIFLALFIVVSVVLGQGYAITVKDDQAAQSFSKLTYTTGLVETEYAFDNNRFRELLLRGTVKQGVLYTKDKNAKETADFITKALDIFNANQGLSKTEFKLVDTHIDKTGHLHIITTQYINGIHVGVSKVALHFDSTGTLYEITGQHMPNQNISVIPKLSGEEATERGKTVVKNSSTVYGIPTLEILDERLTYRMYLCEENLPGEWKIIVDAQSGVVLEKSSSLQHFNPPGFPSNGSISQITGNIVTHEEVTSEEQVTVSGWFDNTNSKWYLFNNNEHWQVVDSAATPHVIFNKNTNTWTESNANRPAMTLARNIGRVLEFTQNCLGHNSFNGNGAMCQLYYRDNIIDAWFSPAREMFFFGGGNGSNFLTLVTLDCVAHEFAHGLTHHHSNFEYYNDQGYSPSGALNEAYSDITGICVESYYQQDGREHYIITPRSEQAESDWLMGEDFSRHNDQTRWWLRNIRQPLESSLENDGQGSSHPSFYLGSGWRSNNEPHYNSTVGSFAFYLMSEGVGVESINDPGTNKPNFPYGPFRGLGIDVARNIAWGAQFDGLLLSNATYRNLRIEWIRTARNHGYDASIVAQACAAAGIISSTVNKPSGCALPQVNYSTITQAINNSASGDLIYVFPKSGGAAYVENITIGNIQNLAIVSRNRDLVTIDGTITLSSAADGITITGFTIDASSSTDGITLSGSGSNKVEKAVLGGNRFQNCRNGIAMNYTSYCKIYDNQFTTCSNNSIYSYDTYNCYIVGNNISGTGIQLDATNSYNEIYNNRMEDITGNGVDFAGSLSSYALEILSNEMNNISGYNIISSTAQGYLFAKYNTFSHQNLLNMYIPSNTQAYVVKNTFNANAYNITAGPTCYFYESSQGNYWNNYTGVDTDGDGIGNTMLPHLGLDWFPFMNPQALPLHFKYNNITKMASSVCGNIPYWDGQSQVRLSGCVLSGPLGTGLKFNNAASLSDAGILTAASQTLVSSGPWLDKDNGSNLTGGLVFKDAVGKAQIHISTDGIIRTRNSITPNF